MAPPVVLWRVASARRKGREGGSEPLLLLPSTFPPLLWVSCRPESPEARAAALGRRRRGCPDSAGSDRDVACVYSF